MKELFLNTAPIMLTLGILTLILFVLWIIVLSFREEISKGFAYSLVLYMLGFGLFLLFNFKELLELFGSAFNVKK